MTKDRRCFVVFKLSLLAALLLAVVGCSKPKTLEKMAISGKVTYNGKSLESGEILFKPKEGSNVPPSAAVITNGDYKAPAGIAAGTYRVEVTAYKTGDSLPGIERPAATPGVIPMGRQNYLPEKFNTKSTLEDLVVQSGKPVQKNYDLKD